MGSYYIILEGIKSKELEITIPVKAVEQWSPTFLVPGTSFVEDNFYMNGGGWFYSLPPDAA